MLIEEGVLTFFFPLRGTLVFSILSYSSGLRYSPISVPNHKNRISLIRQAGYDPVERVMMFGTCWAYQGLTRCRRALRISISR